MVKSYAGIDAAVTLLTIVISQGFLQVILS